MARVLMIAYTTYFSDGRVKRHAHACRLFGTRVVLDIHDTMPELYRDKFGGRRGALGARMLEFEERASTWLAHRVLAVHEPHRARLARAGVRAGKLRVVVNVPDSRIFRSARNTAPEADSKFTAVFHGTVARRLGLDVALDAFSILRDACPDIRLLVIGAGDYLPEARALVERRRGLGERVRFLDPVPTERLPQLLSQAAIGLVPNHASSATHLMLPDYAALGIPIIAARLRTIEHYFDRSSAEFFEPDNAADLARAIERLRANEQRRRELAAGARKVVERISWDAQRTNLYDAIDSLAEERRGEAPAEVRVDAS